MGVRAAFSTMLICVACGDPVLAVSKNGVEPFEPLPDYPAFWADTETCSGTEGDLERVSWFRAVSLSANGQILRGLWEPPHDITIWRGFEDERDTVRHEMLHDLLGGDPDHRLRAWADCDLLPT